MGIFPRASQQYRLRAYRAMPNPRAFLFLCANLRYLRIKDFNA